MRNALRNLSLWTCALLLSALFLPLACRASNAVLGEIHFEGKSKVEKTSGVWVDGEYVGYMKELSGSKKVMLLPGEHTIVVRQDGYNDFTQKVTVQPGEEQVVNVAMEKAETPPASHTTSAVKIAANPSRAAVFVDGLFVGHVGEFRGWGRAMLIEPGEHQIRIALPGYQTFEAEINARPNEKLEIKTDLLKSNVPLADPLLHQGESSSATIPATEGAPNAIAAPAGK